MVWFEHLRFKRLVVINLAIFLAISAILDLALEDESWYRIVLAILSIIASITGFIGACTLNIRYLEFFLGYILILFIFQIIAIIYLLVQHEPVQIWIWNIVTAIILVAGAIATHHLRRAVETGFSQNQGQTGYTSATDTGHGHGAPVMA